MEKSNQSLHLVIIHAIDYIFFTFKRYSYWMLLVLLIFSTLNLTAQDNQVKVTGHVDGEDGQESLPGVTIQIQGTSNGVVTDIDGNYTIYASADDKLVFSFIGYLKEVVPVNNRTRIDVKLKLDLQELEEVVVVGYGEQKKANLTGAVTTIKPEELEEIPTGNLSQTLIGKLAGVQVNRNGTGIPGTPSPLVIRAESASGGISRQVLYVIDGVIFTNEQDGTGPSGDEIFNRLDPTEIENISILKDAAAAVYGARAAGGVVVVTTKRGKKGKPRFSYSGSIGIGQPTQIPEMLSGYEHALMLNEISKVKGSLPGNRPPRAADLYTPEELEIIKSRDYNWLDGLFKAAETHRHALNVSGGSETVRYFVGGNYYYESGNYDNLYFRRFGLRSNIEADITNNVKFNIGMSFSEGERKNPSYDPGSGNVGTGVLRDWYKRPLTAPKWLDPLVEGLPTKVGTSWNPYGLLQSNSNRLNSSNNTSIIPKLTYDVPFVKGLKLSTQVSINFNTSSGTTFNQNYDVYEQKVIPGGNADKLIFSDTLTGNVSEINNSEGLGESWSKGVNYQWNSSVNYTKTFKKHNVNALLVYEQADGESRQLSLEQTGANVRGYPYVWAFSANGITNRGDYGQVGRWGVIGRLNYDYDGKYLFESTFRGESSSKFAASERFGIFPAVSMGWVISEEAFFNQTVPFIDFLKIRVSTGIVGNDNTRPYEHRPAFIPESGASGPIFGTGSGSLSNVVEARNNGFTIPSRTWAKVNNNNIGMDFRGFDNRLSLTLEYYYNRTYDGFDRNSTYPFVIGNAKPPFENYRESFSTGQELQLGWSDKIGEEFSYSIDANFSKRRSRPLKLYQNPAVLGTWVDDLANDDSNQPGYVALGIIRTDEDIERIKAMYWDQSFWQDGLPTIFGIPIAKGMIYYQDLGGENFSREPDGVFDGNDRTIIAEYTTPPYSYGFSLGASWRGIRISASFGGVFGHKEFINKDEQAVPTNNENVFAWWRDYYTEGDENLGVAPNLNSSLPRPFAYGAAGETSTFWMRDGHTLRLNFLNVSYQMPKKLADRMKLSSWKMFMSATNVLTIISPFDYKDPAVARGYDYPLVRTINIGTNFSL
ncbi:MAG: SusC/RagA family TonB-linked outer membrane protein [Cyclobacteriaceae bacterium]